MTLSSHRHEPLFDIDPVTGASIEIFWADATLATFGRVGAGWWWHFRLRGLAPDGPAHGPFPTSYSAYKDALHSAQRSGQHIFFGVRLQSGCNDDSGENDRKRLGIFCSTSSIGWWCPRGGIEPPTLRFSVACSIQLSYGHRLPMLRTDAAGSALAHD